MRISTLYFYFLKVSFLSQEIYVIFIKTKMVHPLKFLTKLKGTPHQCDKKILIDTCQPNYIIRVKFFIGADVAFY